MLNIVKAYVGMHPILFSKIMRIFRHAYTLAYPSKDPESNKHHPQHNLPENSAEKQQLIKMANQVRDLIGKYMLPGICCSDCNPGLVNELWNVFKLFDYRTRFGLYLDSHTGSNYAYGYMLIKQGKAMREIKEIFNKFNQDNKKQYAKKIVKLANNNPLTIQGFILKRIL